MKLEYTDIANRHKDVPALVIGHGPSFNSYIPLINEYKNKGYVIYGCNDWFHVYDPCPNYWVLASNVDTIEKYVDTMNRFSSGISVLYADSVDLSNRDWVSNNLKVDYLPYDQKHFDGLPCCDKKCCVHAIPGRLTIQQELQKISSQNIHYGSGDTVILHSLAFSVYMGCNPIYLMGMDLDYKKGYAKNTGNFIGRISNTNELSEYTDRHISNLSIIKESANSLGIKIYSGCESMDIVNTIFEYKKPE